MCLLTSLLDSRLLMSISISPLAPPPASLSSSHLSLASPSLVTGSSWSTPLQWGQPMRTLSWPMDQSEVSIHLLRVSSSLSSRPRSLPRSILALLLGSSPCSFRNLKYGGFAIRLRTAWCSNWSYAQRVSKLNQLLAGQRESRQRLPLQP